MEKFGLIEGKVCRNKIGQFYLELIGGLKVKLITEDINENVACFLSREVKVLGWVFGGGFYVSEIYLINNFFGSKKRVC